MYKKHGSGTKRPSGRPPANTIPIEAKRWVIELVCQPPKAVGVVAGYDRSGELWTLLALSRYARERGPKAGHTCLARLNDTTIIEWLKADPETRAKLKLQCLEPPKPKPEPQPKRSLPKRAKGQLVSANTAAAKERAGGGYGFGSRGDDRPARPVSLAPCYFLQRPVLPESDRERLGKDYRPSTLTPTPARLADDEVIATGEAALRRIRGSAPMKDWLDVGRALLILRKRAMVDVGANKPRGVNYVVRNSALIRQHGLTVVSRSARQTAMLVVENLRAIEAWLAKLPDDKRLGLNHPMCLWRQFLAHKKHQAKDAWRERKTIRQEDFESLVAAINQTLSTGDPVCIAAAAARALGYAIPQSVFRTKRGYARRTHPPLPWSPFSLSL